MAKAAGKLSMADMRKLINKRAGMTVAHNLNEENPTEVTDWIPTGSRWLDSIICKGKLAGIPVGKVTRSQVLKQQANRSWQHKLQLMLRRKVLM